jgi:hypothetical protein
MTEWTEPPVAGWHKIDEEWLATPREAHGHSIQPVARVRGWQAASPTDQTTQPAVGGGAFLRIRPVEVRVNRGGEQTQRIALVDPTDAIVQKLRWIAVAVALMAGIVNWGIRRWSKV